MQIPRPKPPKFIKIVASLNLDPTIPSYDFCQSDPNILQISSFSIKYSKYLYFYSRPASAPSRSASPPRQPSPSSPCQPSLQSLADLIISNTMDSTNKLKFMFMLELRNTPHHYVFIFGGLTELVQNWEGAVCTKEKMQERLGIFGNQARQQMETQGKRYDGKQVQNEKKVEAKKEKSHKKEDQSKQKKKKDVGIYEVNLIKSARIPSYFYPAVGRCPDIWFVPRYMHPMQLQQNMTLRFHFKQNQEVNPMAYEYKDARIEKLSLNYIIEEVRVSQIENNPSLPSQNQQNLFHICDELPEIKHLDTKCYICMEGGEDWIEKKWANLLIDPCYCSGDCKFVHMKCLANWVTTKNNEGIKCPICKKPLPQFLEVVRVRGNGDRVVRYFHLIGSNKTPHVQINTQTIQLFSNQVIYLGSQSCSNFKINSGVKENYAQITYQPNSEKAYISDKKTRFGTLIKKDKMMIKLHKVEQRPYTCTIVVGKMMMHFTICD